MNKERKIEEIKEDKMMEYAHENEDGIFETWVDNNLKELREEFLRDNEMEFKDYCWMSWKEHR